MNTPNRDIVLAEFLARGFKALSPDNKSLLSKPITGGVINNNGILQPNRAYNWGSDNTIEIITADVGTLHVSAVRMDETLDDDISISYVSDRYIIDKTVDEKIFNIKVNTTELTDDQKKSYTYLPDFAWYKGDDSTGVIANSSIDENAKKGMITGTLTNFHYEGADVPFSWQNKYGFNIERQFFDLNEYTQTQFPDRVSSGVDLIRFVDAEGTYIEARINSSSGTVDEDFEIKASGIYNDADGLGDYFYVENKNGQNILYVVIAPITPLVAGKFEFFIQNSHTGASSTSYILGRYNGLNTSIVAYLDTKDAGSTYLVKIVGDRYNIADVINWYNLEASGGEQAEFDALMPNNDFLEIAEYNAASEVSTTLVLFKLVTIIDTSLSTDLTKYSADAFTETQHDSTGVRGWFYDNGYIFPQIDDIQIGVPRITSPPTTTWTRIYTDKSFIEGQSITPRNETEPTKGSNGFPLKNRGEIRQLAKIVGVNVGNFDGTTKLSFSDLTGITIVESVGTATPSINGDDIEFTAGICSYLELSNGSVYRFLGGGNATIEYDLVNSLDGTYASYTLGDQSAKDDDTANYLLINGCEVYAEDSFGIDKIFVPRKEDGSLITPTISGYSKIKDLAPLQKEGWFDNDYDCAINFQGHDSLPDDMPTDYKADDPLPARALCNKSTANGRVKNIVIANQDISNNERLLRHTKTRSIFDEFTLTDEAVVAGIEPELNVGPWANGQGDAGTGRTILNRSRAIIQNCIPKRLLVYVKNGAAPVPWRFELYRYNYITGKYVKIWQEDISVSSSTMCDIALTCTVEAQPGDVAGIYVPDGGNLGMKVYTGGSLNAIAQIGLDGDNGDFASPYVNIAAFTVYSDQPLANLQGDSINEAWSNGTEGETGWWGRWRYNSAVPKNVPGPQSKQDVQIAWWLNQLDRKITYQSLGLGGETFEWIRDTAMPYAVTSAPSKIEIINAGGNDIVASTSWATVEGQLDTILANLPSTTEMLVLTDILPYDGYSDAQSGQIRTFNANFITWAATNDSSLPKGIVVISDHDQFGTLRVSTGYLDDSHPDMVNDGHLPVSLAKKRAINILNGIYNKLFN